MASGKRLIGIKGIPTNRQFWQPPTILHIVLYRLYTGRKAIRSGIHKPVPSLSISKSKTARLLGIDSKKKLTELGVGISPWIGWLVCGTVRTGKAYDGAIAALPKTAGSGICEPRLISQSLCATFSWNFLDG
jgi:hypothetical protein